MAVIDIRNVQPKSDSGKDHVEVHGALSVVGANTVPAGSFQLNSLTAIQLTSQEKTADMIGSVGSPGIWHNEVVLTPILTGTTGTRNTVGEGFGFLGSTRSTGTTEANFIATGF